MHNLGIPLIMFFTKKASKLLNQLKPLLLGTGIFFSLGISGCEENYFVSVDGSDSNSGSKQSPFRTIQKCAEVAQPGASCQIRGGTYRETIKPKHSGTKDKPITFIAYQNETVIISGTETVDQWQQDQDSIFQTQIALPVDGYSDTGFFANQIFVDQETMPEARFPNLESRDLLNPTFLTKGVKSAGGTAAIIENPELPTSIQDWQGAKIWSNEWYTTRTGTITGGSPGKLKAEMTAPWDRGGFRFYLFGKLAMLDYPGEWFYDGEQQTLYFWSLDGNIPQGVEAKQRNFAFDLSDRSYITLKNLNLYANTITTSDHSEGVVIDGIEAKYISHHMTLPPLPKSEQAPNSDNALFLAARAHDTGIQLRGQNHTIKNSRIDWSSGNGILLEGTNHQVTNNIITNTNYLVSYAAPVRVNGSGHRITHNTIKRTGRDGINIDWHTTGTKAHNIEIAYNDISEFGLLSTDLGAIYVCCYVDLEGGSIHHNWIHDAKAFSQFWGTRGIYLDIKTFNSKIHHNVVWNLIGGKHSFYLSARGPKGKHQVFNNTFLGEIRIDEYAEARNNIFVDTQTLDKQQKSHNLLLSPDTPLFVRPPTEDLKGQPDFGLLPDSVAVDAGTVIPSLTAEFTGDAPDLGAYELDGLSWKAGADLSEKARL